MISYNVVIKLCLVPELQSILLTNVNGNLTVMWTFLHTGGIPLNSIIIYISIELKTHYCVLQ